MDTMTGLVEKRDSLFRQIAAAAQERDTTAVLALSRELERIESLIRRQEELNRSVAEALKKGPSVRSVGVADGSATVSGSELSPKARGRCQRDAFLQSLQRARGVTLERVEGIVFKTLAGVRVGIPYARESKEKNRDRWWLGLPGDRFDHAVLLCEEASGKVTHLSLPQEFLSRYGRFLSRADGQVKFTVIRREGRAFFLDVPRGQGQVSLEAYRDNFCGLG